MATAKHIIKTTKNPKTGNVLAECSWMSVTTEWDYALDYPENHMKATNALIEKINASVQDYEVYVEATGMSIEGNGLTSVMGITMIEG